MNPLLAVLGKKPTVWEKFLAVPQDTWVSLLVGFVILVLLSRVWKNLKEINEVVPWIALFSIGSVVLLYWTYERQEPRLLSPLIDKLAEVLPTRVARPAER